MEQEHRMAGVGHKLIILHSHRVTDVEPTIDL